MAVARILSAQINQRAIDFVHRDRATLDVDQTMRIAPVKSDYTILRVNRDSIAIAVLLRRGNHRAHRKVSEFTDALQNIADLAPFDRELMLVIDMLIGTAATSAEIWTGRRKPMGRGFFNIDKLGFGELFFLAHDFGRNGFAFDSVGNENRLAVFARDAFAAKGNVLDC